MGPLPSTIRGMDTTHLLYLHGFRSSPRSFKAQRMEALVRERHPAVTWWCPQLPPSPREAIDLLQAGMRHWPLETTRIVGSLLGGFYATVLAERTGCEAVLLNPAVHPARDLARHIGQMRQWHSDEVFFFRPEFVTELQTMAPGELRDPSRYFAVIATGDEVLDWREMSERYRGAHLRIVEGSDHGLTDFDVHLPHVLHFLDLAPRG